MSERKDNEPLTYYVLANGCKEYFKYDRQGRTATMHDGRRVYITEERLLDFLHTADMLGFKAGKV